MPNSVIVYDPLRSLSEPWKDYFLENRLTWFIWPCSDGPVELQGNWMLLNIMLMEPLIKRHMPIFKEHLFTSGIYNAKSHSRTMTRVSETLEEAGYKRDELYLDMIIVAMNAQNICYTHLPSYVQTMDIFTMANTIDQPAVRAATTMDYGDIDDLNINRMEEAFKEKCKEVDAVLGDSSADLLYNCFRLPLLCGALKPQQFYQYAMSGGPRTDTDEQMFKRPVVGSFLGGMHGALDLAIESRAAAKSELYSVEQMQDTGYRNRKNNIQNSAMWHLYPGDCGSTVYLDYTITKETVGRYKGKYFIDEPSGQLLELTTKRYPMVIDKTVKIRAVPGCRYVDGYCETCGGTLSKSFSKTGVVGFLCNVYSGAVVAQLVLSAKHLSMTTAAKYEVPEDLDALFISVDNYIFLRPNLSEKIKDLAIGFKMGDVFNVNDLQYQDDNKALNRAHFSSISTIKLGRVLDNGNIKPEITHSKMGEDVRPSLSPEILTMLVNHPEDLVTIDNVTWLKLTHVDVTHPIMECTVTNQSIVQFVKRFNDFLTKGVVRHTSLNVVVRTLAEMLWGRNVDTHITHIECMARSCLVTSKSNLHVPVIDDPNRVQFGEQLQIIPMRSIGGLLAFERINLATNSPATYITPKHHGWFDDFMGYTDQVEALMHWPPNSDKLREEPFDAPES